MAQQKPNSVAIAEQQIDVAAATKDLKSAVGVIVQKLNHIARNLTADVTTMQELFPDFLDSISAALQQQTSSGEIDKTLKDPKSKKMIQIQVTKAVSQKRSLLRGSKAEIAVIGKMVLKHMHDKQSRRSEGNVCEDAPDADENVTPATSDGQSTVTDAVGMSTSHSLTGFSFDGALVYTVTCESGSGLAFRRSRLWDDKIEEKPYAKVDELIQVCGVSPLRGVTWAHCVDGTFLPIERNRTCYLVRELVDKAYFTL